MIRPPSEEIAQQGHIAPLHCRIGISPNSPDELKWHFSGLPDPFLTCVATPGSGGAAQSETDLDQPFARRYRPWRLPGVKQFALNRHFPNERLLNADDMPSDAQAKAPRGRASH
jgi:hypothetical protein